MASTTQQPPQVKELVRRLDLAVESEDPKKICQGVKQALIDLTEANQSFLPNAYLQPAPDAYARRLLHKDPQNRYSVVIMVWDVGQGTPLHDHAGKWCVEAVYRGKIRVRSFELERYEGETYHFTQQSEVISGIGEAGMLIPPLEHHILENPFDTKAITIHVYSQELTWCHAFFPQEGNAYRRERRELCYTD